MKALCVLLMLVTAAAASGDDEHAAEHLMETYNDEGNSTLMSADEVGDLLAALLRDEHFRENGKNASEIMEQFDGNSDGQLNETELTNAGLRMVQWALDMTCVREADVTAGYFGTFHCSSSSNASANAHAGHAHHRRRLAQHDDHDDHGHDEHGDEHGDEHDEHPELDVDMAIGGHNWTCSHVEGTAGRAPVVSCGDPHAHHDHGDEHGDEHGEEEEVDLTGEKVGYLFLILVLGLAGGFLPVSFSSKFQDSKAIRFYLGLGNAFSGGVFLATTFTHILPEAIVAFKERTCVTIAATGQNKWVRTDRTFYPVIPLLVVVGYYIILFVERVAFGDAHSHHHGDCAGGDGSPRVAPQKPAAEGEPVVVSVREAAEAASVPKIARKGTGKDSWLNAELVGPYLLMLALSLHSVFAGLALGVMHERSELVALLTAIVSHKFIEAMALGANFVENGATFKQAAPSVLFFGLTTPVGVAIGIGLSELDMALTSAVLQGIACGTFLYVGTTEVMPKEFGPGTRAPWLKFALAFLGTAIISLIGLAHNHEH